VGKLRAARLEAGFTQIEAARRLGKPQTFISKIELGERRVDIVELHYIAKIYKKPVSFFEPSA
jgi:transcriptional regulator with XRE-family HTH domain